MINFIYCTPAWLIHLFQPFIYVCIGVEPSLIQHIRAVDRDEGWLIAFIKPSFAGFLLGSPHTHIPLTNTCNRADALTASRARNPPFFHFFATIRHKYWEIPGLCRVFPGWILLVCVGGKFFILTISDVLSQIRQPNGGRQWWWWWWWWWNVSLQGSFCFYLICPTDEQKRQGRRRVQREWIGEVRLQNSSSCWAGWLDMIQNGEVNLINEDLW